jgi:type II secretory pathway pseudopilin PulG
MRRSIGATLLEVMIVVTVTAVLVAMLYPVVRQALKRAKENVCVSNLRQMVAALDIYRANYDGTGIYGDYASMGLPPSKPSPVPAELLSIMKLNCTGVSFLSQIDTPLYMAMWIRRDWERTVTEHKDDTAVYADLNHSFPGRSIFSTGNTHRAFAVYLSGYVKTKTKKGDPTTVSWWSPSSE